MLIDGKETLLRLYETAVRTERGPRAAFRDEVVKRMSDTPKDKQAEEGINICIETIQRLKEVEGVSGFHIMAIEWEEKVPEIVERSGLFPRPTID